MEPLPQPSVILTHESDLDGFVSGLLLQRLATHLFQQTPRIEAYHNHNWRQRPMSEKCAWVSDFSFDSRLDRPNWVIFDHHLAEAAPKKATLIHDASRSAGSICYEACRNAGLHTPELDRLVQLNNVADMFLNKDPEFLLAMDYAGLIKSYGFWNVHTLLGGRLEAILNHPLLEVMAIKRRIEDPLGFDWSRQHIREISPTVGLVNTVIGNTNLIIHQMLDAETTPYKVLVTLYRKSANTHVVSLRSRNGEALEVAGKLQGGGHPNASGATLPKSVQTAADAVVYLQQVLQPASTLPPEPLNPLESAFD